MKQKRENKKKITSFAVVNNDAAIWSRRNKNKNAKPDDDDDDGNGNKFMLGIKYSIRFSRV